MTERSKGKYGALIQKAREPENQKAGKPVTQITSNPENEDKNVGSQKTTRPEIQKTKEPDNQITSNPETKTRKVDSQKTGKPANQITSEPVNQITSNPENEDKKVGSQKTGKPESQKTSEPESEVVPEREVNLCVKVPESLRRHWAAESKRKGMTMTAAIVKALEEQFGRPE